MTDLNQRKFTSSVFLTFSGNCKEALTFYQSCFGGALKLETFEKEMCGDTERPVVTGSLIAENLVIHGTDLVHDEGRIMGNYMSIFVHCTDSSFRRELISRLQFSKLDFLPRNYNDDKLVELIDPFDVRWILYA